MVRIQCMGRVLGQVNRTDGKKKSLDWRTHQPTFQPAQKHGWSYLVYFKVAWPEGSHRVSTQEGLRELAVWKPPPYTLQMTFAKGKLYKSTKSQSSQTASSCI